MFLTKRLNSFVLFALFAALAITAWRLLNSVGFEWGDHLNPDALIYATMGRGLLNGLRPYVDLFESKPPGIFYVFLLASLSKNLLLLKMADIGILIALPITLAWNVRKRGMLIFLCTLLFGMLLSIHIQEDSGALQSEIFGILPAAIYSVTVIWHKDRRDLWMLLLRSLCIFFSIAIREPYILGLAAAGLIASEGWRDVRDYFVLPALGAGVLFGAFLLVTGTLPSYISTYIPAMIQRSSDSAGNHEPFLEKILWAHRLLSSWTIFGVMPLFGYFLAGIWVFAVGRRNVFTIIGVVLGTALLHELFVLERLFYFASQYSLTPWQVLTDPTFTSISYLYLFGIIAYVSYLAFILWRRPISVLHICFGLASLLPLNLSIGIGGYTPNYLLYGIPAYLAAFHLVMRERQYLPMVAFTLVLSCVWYPAPLRLANVEAHEGWIAQAEHRAGDLDAVMDACGYSRFAYLGSFPQFGLARHSPIGPIFSPYFHLYMKDGVLLQKTYENIKAKAKILVEEKGGLTQDSFTSEVQALFAEKNPKCAEGLPVPDGYSFLYSSSK